LTLRGAMSSLTKPYATVDDEHCRSEKPVVPNHAAPWEKNQAPRMQSKAGKLNPSGMTPAALAPYGNNANVKPLVPPAPSSPSSAPFGISENKTGETERPKRRGPPSPVTPSPPPFGTTADPRTVSQGRPTRLASPWERDESKYTHKGKVAGTDSVMAPYATES